MATPLSLSSDWPTPIIDCQINKNVKFVIKFSVYLDFLYSTLLWNLLWLFESMRESARKKRKRGKIQFWTSYYKFSNRPDYYRPTFFITITIIFHCCMGLGLQYASENGQPRQTAVQHPSSRVGASEVRSTIFMQNYGFILFSH